MVFDRFGKDILGMAGPLFFFFLLTGERRGPCRPEIGWRCEVVSRSVAEADAWLKGTAWFDRDDHVAAAGRFSVGPTASVRGFHLDRVRPRESARSLLAVHIFPSHSSARTSLPSKIILPGKKKKQKKKRKKRNRGLLLFVFFSLFKNI